MSINIKQRKTTGIATQRTRLQRFIDWLAGGPPDPEKIKVARLKPWHKTYQLSLLWGGLWLSVLAYPLIVSYINIEPELNQLQPLQVRIVQTRDRSPHFVMEWPNGERRDVYWPKPLSFMGNFSFYGWTSAERQALIGCQATAQVSSIRYWILAYQYRVWALSCPAIGFVIESAKLQEGLAEDLEYRLRSFFGLTLFILAPLGFIFHLRERRGVL